MKLSDPRTSPLKKYYHQWITTAGVTIIMIEVGLICSWSSLYLARLTSANSPLPLTTEQASWVASLFSPGWFIGAIVGSISVSDLGSKSTVLISVLPICGCWVLTMCANSAVWLYFARLFGGLGTGMTYSCLALYVGEIAVPEIRGAIMSAAITGGCTTGVVVTRVEFVRQLLEEKADVKRQVPNDATLQFAGYTPLHFAVESGNHEVAQLLLKRGARIYEDDFNRVTPVHLACYRRDTRMVDLILTHDRVTANVVDKNGLSHFVVACTSSEPAFAEEQLRVADCRPWTSSKVLIKSCTKNTVDGQFSGYTPLHFAAEFGSVEVLGMLLVRGARCCATTGQSLTPLMLAHRRGHKDIVRILSEFCVGYRIYEEVALKVNGGVNRKRDKVTDVCENKQKACGVNDQTCDVDSSRKGSALKRTVKITCISPCCKAVNGKRIRQIQSQST